MTSPSRFAELINLLKEEYDRVSTENASLKSIRNDWNRRVSEQTSEMDSMLSELRDLERKHQLVKEQYEAEILRLKSHPQQPPTQPQPQPQPQPQQPPPPSAPQKPTQSYAPLQSEPHTISPMFASRPLAHQGAAAATAATAAAAAVAAPQPPPTLRPMMSSLSSAPAPAPVGANAPPSAIPSLNNPAALPRGPVPPPSMMQSKMPSMSIAHHTGAVREPSLTHSMKKDVAMPLQQSINPPSMLVPSTASPFVQQQQQPIRPPILSTASNPPPSQAEDDWLVYQGRTPTGSVTTMKVQLQHTMPLESVVCCVRYSWDGQYLATGSNHAAHIFDTTTGQNVGTFAKDDGTPVDRSGPDRYVRAVCFSPDGNWLITGAEDHMVKVWDIRNRKVKHRLIGHGTDIYSVDASADSRFIISGSGDKKAKMWHLESGKLLNTLGGEYGPADGITSVAVSPSSQHVAAGSLDKIVRVWDAEEGRLVRQFEGHTDSVYSVAFSPDGRLLLSGSLDRTLKLWELSMPQTNTYCRMSFPGHKDFVLSVAFSPNSQWLISGSKDRTVQFWDPRQPSMCMMLQGHKNSVISIAHDPTSKALATGSGDCRSRTWMYS